MGDKSANWLLGLLLGAVAGSLVAVVVWRVADRRLRAALDEGGMALSARILGARGQLVSEAQLAALRVDQEVSAAVSRYVVPAVRTEVRSQLAAANVTPELVRDVRAALERLRRAGLL